MAKVLVFDVNETLLDLAVLRAPFDSAFGDAAPLGEWFARLLHGSLVATVTDSYEDFASIGRRALDAVASRRGRKLEPAERDAILATMLELPAHPEVPDALRRLKGTETPIRLTTCIFRVTCDATPRREASAGT
ncbi:MAG: hypothetical protein H0T07_07075, partial [Actinobacteria bacterium]|nr:hypothetical protein [Actinomycetota bacterium]